MYFEILEPLRNVEAFAVGSAIRDLPRLRRTYGRGRWRKRKGTATVRFADGAVVEEELHWYEATGLVERKCGSNGSLVEL